MQGDTGDFEPAANYFQSSSLSRILIILNHFQSSLSSKEARVFSVLITKTVIIIILITIAMTIIRNITIVVSIIINHQYHHHDLRHKNYIHHNQNYDITIIKMIEIMKVCGSQCSRNYHHQSYDVHLRKKYVYSSS